MLNNLLYGKDSYRDTIANIEQSLEEPRMVIKIFTEQSRGTSSTTFSIACHNKSIKLEPADFTLLLWFAKLAKEEKGGQSPKFFSEQYDGFLELCRLITKDKDKVSKIEDTINRLALKGKPMSAYLSPKITTIRDALTEEIGPAAEHYIIHNLGKHKAALYGLRLKPEQIEIIAPKEILEFSIEQEPQSL